MDDGCDWPRVGEKRGASDLGSPHGSRRRFSLCQSFCYERARC